MAKRLVICLDGTTNRLDAKYPTNVVIAAESVIPFAPDGKTQVVFYDEGVGTEEGEAFKGGLFGVGMLKNINDAYRFIILNYTPGDEIYVFGFSRGAYTARSLVGLLYNCGIPRRCDAGQVTEAVRLYESRNPEDAPDAQKMLEYRKRYSPDLCVGEFEDAWRCANVEGYTPGSNPILQVTYLGVWDTVGSLGVPQRYRFWDRNKSRHDYHDVGLTRFVKSGRHAVAIDEARIDFAPTLWEDVAALNEAAGHSADAPDAPYQQQWFPGDHGSVGGGGDVRGLSDQALDWVLDGARHAGLRLDSGPNSRIYEFAPDHTAVLTNATPLPKQSFMSRAMGVLPTEPRKGPTQLYEVSLSAQRRWHEVIDRLPGKAAYRPKPLMELEGELKQTDPSEIGLGPEVPLGQAEYVAHEVQPGETLSLLAKRHYNDAELWPHILAANRYKVSNPDRIYVGQVLRIPLNPPSRESQEQIS